MLILIAFLTNICLTHKNNILSIGINIIQIDCIEATADKSEPA